MTAPPSRAAPAGERDRGGIPPGAPIDAIEELAVELAREGGRTIAAALAGEIRVEYKGEARGEHAPTDPVSEVDHAIERLVRERVGRLFPAHGLIGEEGEGGESDGGRDPDWVWVIDPVDGTTNFINGFPLFGCSIGVLYRGYPVIGAIWCSTGHALSPGVYHARAGGPLCFEGEAVEPRPPGGSGTVRRGLSAAPGGSPGREQRWDHRTTGSAVSECVFVATGIFQSALFWGLHIWDVAAGVVLVRAGGREVWLYEGRSWRPFERFEAPRRVPGPPGRRGPRRAPTLRDWRMPLVIGTAEAAETVRRRQHQRRWRWRWIRWRRRVRGWLHRGGR